MGYRWLRFEFASQVLPRHNFAVLYAIRVGLQYYYLTLLILGKFLKMRIIGTHRHLKGHSKVSGHRSESS